MNRFDFNQIPPHMMDALRRYTEQHHPVGDFLQAVIGNDLAEACARADDTNIEIIPVYVAWFYSQAPAPYWGSRAKYTAWIHQPRVPGHAPRVLSDGEAFCPRCQEIVHTVDDGATCGRCKLVLP